MNKRYKQEKGRQKDTGLQEEIERQNEKDRETDLMRKRETNSNGLFL